MLPEGPGSQSRSANKVRSKVSKKSYFHQRSGSQGKGHYLDVEDDPISSYVPQTTTYQERARGFKPVTPLYIPVQSKHRSAEGGKLEFTALKPSEMKAHSARESHRVKEQLGQYLPVGDESPNQSPHNVSSFI